MKKKRFYEILEEVNKLQAEMIDILLEEEREEFLPRFASREFSIDESCLSTINIRITR